MTWVGTGVAIVGTASSIMGGRAANKAAEEAAKDQAALTFRQRQEEIRLQKSSNQQQKGLTIAKIGASNILKTGSAARFLNSMNTENMRQVAFAQDAARLEKSAIEKGARGAGASLFANAGQQLGQLAGTLAANYMKSSPTLGNASGHAAQDMSPGLGGGGVTHSGFGSVTPTSTNAGAG